MDKLSHGYDMMDVANAFYVWVETWFACIIHLYNYSYTIIVTTIMSD